MLTYGFPVANRAVQGSSRPTLTVTSTGPKGVLLIFSTGFDCSQSACQILDVNWLRLFLLTSKQLVYFDAGRFSVIKGAMQAAIVKRQCPGMLTVQSH